MSGVWFLRDSRGRVGPFTDTQVIETLASHSDLAEVFASETEDGPWRPVLDVPELRGPVAPSPSELQTPVAASSAAIPALVLRTEEGRELKTWRPAKWRWMRNGALVGAPAGFVIGVVVAVLRGKFSITNLPEAFGFVIGSALPWAFIGGFIGLVAGVLKDFFTKPAPVVLSIPAVPVMTSSRLNFVAAHWRGQYPLWVSYWIINGVIPGAVLGLVLIAVASLKSSFRLEYEPTQIFFTIFSVWLFVAVVTVWQIVGLWRSANNRVAQRASIGKRAPWATLAKFSAILIVIQGIAVFAMSGWPQLRETFRMAFMGDPDMPDYAFRLMRDGTEIEIRGGFKYGLTHDFSKLLKESGRIRVVHLDSIGGRIGEAEKLFKIIRDEGLTTYVSSKCASACTLAFAAGRQRYISKSAILAFHAPAFPGLDKKGLEENVAEQTELFSQAGFSPDFVKRALTTPNEDLWKPTIPELLEAKAITGVSDGTQFAASGYGDTTKEGIATTLAKASSVFAAIKEHLPDDYDTMVDTFYQSYLRGDTEARSVEIARAQLVQLLGSLRPLADDDVLADFAILTSDTFQRLRLKSAKLCYDVALDTKGVVSYREFMSEDLLKRDVALNERIIRTAVKRDPVDDSETAQLWPQVRKMLNGLGVANADIELLGSEKVAPGQYEAYCKAQIALFKAIGTMPVKDAAILMRATLTAK
jgi:hypothetical protein